MVCPSHRRGKRLGVTTARVTIDAPLPEVWDVVVDARSYPEWLVGARKIRAVDDGWPAPGTAFHHEVGVGPLRIADRTRSIGVEENRRLKLDVRALPLMHGEVTIELRPSPGGTEVALEEHSIGWHRFLAPLVATLGLARNHVSLDNLGDCVRERSGGS